MKSRRAARTKRAASMLCVCALALGGCAERRDGSLVLRVANWGGPAGDPAFLKLERELREQFERGHPHIRVRMENIPGPGQYVPKLLMTFLAGNPPDVITLDAASAAVFLNNGLLADLMPFIRQDRNFCLEHYASNALDVGLRKDRLYAVPLDFTPMVVVFNKRLFADARIPCPRPGWTRDEFLETARALTVSAAGRSPRYGFTFDTSMAMWLPWVWAAGCDVLSPDGRRAVGYLDSPATLETLQFLVDLVRKHRVAPSLSQGVSSGVDWFRDGRAAMTVTGHWSLIDYKADRMDIGVASIPGTGAARAAILYEAGLGIARASRQPQIAWDYIAYMTGEAVQRRRSETGLAISAHTGVAQSRESDPVEAAFLAEIPHARPPWGSRVERYDIVEDLGREMMEDMLSGRMSVREAAARTAALIEREMRDE